LFLSFSFLPSRKEAQKCYCGETNCRGYIGADKQRTPLKILNKVAKDINKGEREKKKKKKEKEIFDDLLVRIVQGRPIKISHVSPW
jgi:hypothetical protein